MRFPCACGEREKWLSPSHPTCAALSCAQRTRSSGLVVRDARRCRAPHHEGHVLPSSREAAGRGGGSRPHPEELAKQASRRMKPLQWKYSRTEEIMRIILAKLAATLLALALISAPAAAQTKVTIAVGGGACLCYLQTVLAKQLGEYDKAGLSVELFDLKGGSGAPRA